MKPNKIIYLVLTLISLSTTTYFGITAETIGDLGDCIVLGICTIIWYISYKSNN